MKATPIMAYAQAVLVTFLWSSSFILIKFGLLEIPPFLFAAVRYTLAFSTLGIIYLALGNRAETSRKKAVKTDRKLLLVAGICGYTIAQGLLFVGLFYLPAVTTSFLLNLTPIFVVLMGIAFLEEKASRLQILGLAVALLGVYAFFSEKLPGSGQQLGVLVITISGLAWAIYMIVIRRIQRADSFGSLRLTVVTMGIGVAGLLLLAGIFDGSRSISLNALVIILWLGVVNTALAFLLWNHALRVIRAFELSVIQNSMLVQIALLAWIFLGEFLTYFMMLGMALVIVGVVLVQVSAIRVRHRELAVAS